MITPSFGLTATERVLPRLALDWTTGLAQTGVDVVRTGVSTFVGSNGLIQSASANTQRVDWSTGTAGLLIEESRTNLFKWSQDFNNAYWLKTGVASINPTAAVAPDGTTTANLVTFTGVGGNQTVYNYNTLTGTYSHSFFIKAEVPDDVGKTIRLDTTGAGAGVTNVTLTDSWQRVLVTNNPAGYFQIRLISAPGNTAEKFLLWGGQQESGAFPTSHIPTTTVAVTRNADVATMTGTNFSDWYNPTESTFLFRAASASATGIASVPNVFAVTDGTIGDRIRAYLYGNVGTQITVGGVGQASLVDGLLIANNTFYNGVLGYKADNFGLSVDANTPLVDASGTIPTVDSLDIGSQLGTGFLNGHIQKLFYYPQKLTTNEIQAFSKG
jgi:hypothetical protein